jgi:hypothetical protein
MVLYNGFEQDSENTYVLWAKPGPRLTSAAVKFRATDGSEYIAVRLDMAEPRLIYFTDFRLLEMDGNPIYPYEQRGGRFVGKLKAQQFFVIYNPNEPVLSVVQNDLADPQKVKAILKALDVEDKSGLIQTTIVKWTKETLKSLRETAQQISPTQPPVATASAAGEVAKRNPQTEERQTTPAVSPTRPTPAAPEGDGMPDFSGAFRGLYEPQKKGADQSSGNDERPKTTKRKPGDEGPPRG